MVVVEATVVYFIPRNSSKPIKGGWTTRTRAFRLGHQEDVLDEVQEEDRKYAWFWQQSYVLGNSLQLFLIDLRKFVGPTWKIL